jgi:glycosyltransferase involved in cell wall biosynthesis
MPNSLLEGQSIVCFAGEDWWFHNPHSNLHIMQALSSHNRILFVNSPGIRMPDFRNDKFAFKRVLKKLQSFSRFVRKAQPNIWVFTPFAIPLVPRYQKFISRFNTAMLLFQVRMLMRWLKLDKPILWVTVLVAKDVALTLRRKEGKCLVYYCVDNTPHYPGVDHSYMIELENDLHKNADLALFVNHTLLEERRHFNASTFYTGHGVDYSHFAQAQRRTLPVPPDIAAIKGPIAGYMGEINSLDVDLLKYLARSNPQVSFVFIGDMYADMTAIDTLGNVHFLGKRTYEQLPAYLQCFDVCCLYYKTQTTFNNYRNPKKLLEYLATGKPIVSVSILEIERFRDHVAIASSYEDYSVLLQRAIHADPEEDRERRIRYAEQQTWEHVSAEISERILGVVRS